MQRSRTEPGSIFTRVSRGRSVPLWAVTARAWVPSMPVRITPPDACHRLVVSVRHAASLTAVEELLAVGK
jgi:predicted transcriptional regulator